MSFDKEDIDKTASVHTRLEFLTIGQYRVLRKLGSGGMGAVFLAEDTRLHRSVALKVLSPELANRTEFRERFLREARNVASVSHPNICGIFGVEESEGLPVIVLEYVRGRTLREILAAGPFAFDAVDSVAMQCCHGLQAAHHQNLIHRDIKSANIMCDANACIKILDFGLAKRIGEDPHTQTGAVLGTYSYMSPEQVLGRPLDRRSDLFSLGIVLYELVTGHLPFSGDNLATIALAITTQPAIPILRIRPDTPDYLWSTIQKLLEKDPADRFQSAREVSESLERRAVPLSPSIGLAKTVVKRLAIFPFRTLSEGNDELYIIEGMCEDLCTRLSQVRGLHVLSPNATSRVARAGTSPQDAAAALGFSHHIEGSIRRIDSDLRIVLRLIESSTGRILWSQSFDKSLATILALQSEIAESVISALGLVLNRTEKDHLLSRTAVSPDLYDLVLRAKYHVKRREQSSLEKAIALLRQALDQQPTLAIAHANLSQCYRLYLNYGYGDELTFLPAARSHADHAIRIDPESAEAHVALAMLLRDIDFEQAITELRSAIALDPGQVEARHCLAHTYLWRGLYHRGISEERQALALDPFHTTARSLLSRLLLFSGRTEEASQQIETLQEDNLSAALYAASNAWLWWWQREWSKTLDSIEIALHHDANNVYAIFMKVDALRRMGRREEAWQYMETLPSFAGDGHLLPLRGSMLLEKGDQLQANRAFGRSRELILQRSNARTGLPSAVDYYNLAYVDCMAGDTEAFISNIQHAIENGLGHWADLQDRPTFDEMRHDPRVLQIIRDLKTSQQLLDFGSA